MNIQKKFSIYISDYAIERIRQFKEYMIDEYIRLYFDSGIPNEDEFILNYAEKQYQFENELIEKIENLGNCEIIPKWIILMSDDIETYYTYFKLRKFEIKLTCKQNNREKSITIENIIIYR